MIYTFKERYIDMKKTKKLISLLITLSMFSVFSLSGCTPKNMTDNSQSHDSKTLRIAFGAGQSETDLYPPTTANQNLMWSLRPCVEPLIELDAYGNVINVLLESIDANKDFSEYVLNIRQDVFFSDGTALNAEAVKWNLEQTKQHGINDFCNKISQIEIIDDYCLKLYLNQPDVLFVRMLSTNKAALMISPTAVEANGVEWAKTHPVGTGPFCLESWDFGRQMSFVKNENYRVEGLPKLDRIVYQYVNNNAVLRASYLNDEYDVIFSPSSALLSSLSKDGQRCAIYDYANNAFNLWFPSAVHGSPFQNELVRKAVCYAVDMPSILSALYGDEFEASNQLSSPRSPNWDDAIKGYPYNVEKAKELLSEAGYPNGFSTTIITQSNEQNKLLCEAIQASLREIGISLTLDMADEARYADSVILNSWGDQLALIFYTFTPDDISSLVRMLNPDTCIFGHTVNFSDEYRSAFSEIVAASSLEEASGAYRKADRVLIDEDALVFPVYVCNNAIAQKEYVHCIGSGLDGETQLRYWSPENVWLD